MTTTTDQVTADDITSARAFYANFHGDCDTMNEANLTSALGNALGACDVLADALRAMLYIFDRELPESSIGKRICNEARAAISLVGEAK